MDVILCARKLLQLSMSPSQHSQPQHPFLQGGLSLPLDSLLLGPDQVHHGGDVPLDRVNQASEDPLTVLLLSPAPPLSDTQSLALTWLRCDCASVILISSDITHEKFWNILFEVTR